MIVDTDPGNDDAIAILMALSAPDLKVEAITVTPGAYAYVSGWNPAALLALAIGVVLNLPGFLASALRAQFGGISSTLTGLYPYAWFVGGLLAARSYVALMWRGRAAFAPASATIH